MTAIPADSNEAPDEAVPARTVNGRRPRGSIAPHEVVIAAFALAERITVAKLNMAKLAKHLDVPVTSIYWHFRRKEDLLNAMLDHAIRHYHFVTTFVEGDAWDDALRAHFRQMRQVFRENPVLCDLVLMRAGELGPEATHAALDKLETVVETLVAAGFTPDDALEVYVALSVHSRGSALLEHMNSRNPNTKTGRSSIGIHADVLAQAAPSAAQATSLAAVASAATPMLRELASRGRSVADINFEFTLDALIVKAHRLLSEAVTVPDAESAECEA